MEETENKETTSTETTETENKNSATETSVEELIKSFDEKIKKMQDENNKKLADKDEIIKQLILQNNKGEKELTDDEQSIQKITQNINDRR